MADTVFSFSPTAVTTLLTTTLDNRRKEVQDAIFNDLATIKLLRERGSFELKLDGGSTITEPVNYAKNTTGAFYDGYDIIDTTPTDTLTMAQFKWKELAVSVSISNREENVQNQGKSAVIDLVNSKIDVARNSMKDVLNTALFAASPTSKQLNSLATLIDTSTTIGDINSGTYSWWQSVSTASGSFAAQGRSDMLTTYNTLVVRGAAPDFIVTTPTVHQYYEASLIPQLRYTSNDKADGSFGALAFKGVPVIFDTASTSGVMYFLNSQHLRFYVSSSNNMKMTEWVKPYNQTARVAQVILACELGTNNRRRLGKMTSITA
jgi:hypothetical protein